MGQAAEVGVGEGGQGRRGGGAACGAVSEYFAGHGSEEGEGVIPAPTAPSSGT